MGSFSWSPRNFLKAQCTWRRLLTSFAFYKQVCNSSCCNCLQNVSNKVEYWDSGKVFIIWLFLQKCWILNIRLWENTEVTGHLQHRQQQYGDFSTKLPPFPLLTELKPVWSTQKAKEELLVFCLVAASRRSLRHWPAELDSLYLTWLHSTVCRHLLHLWNFAK